MIYFDNRTQNRFDSNKNLTPLLKNIPTAGSLRLSTTASRQQYPANNHYKIKINLESIHYSGKNHGYGWTFVISTLNHHWISTQIQIQRGRKSFVNKDIYHNEIATDFDTLQRLPITLCAQHIGGFRAERTLCLTPNALKQKTPPKSIYTGLRTLNDAFHFHELMTLVSDNAQFMFVLNFEITPGNIPPLTN